ncbi:MAG: DUF4412 domain-containing protein [Desulfococcaceae bacterium]
MKRLMLIAAFWLAAIPAAQADISWECRQVVRGEGWPTRTKTIRHYHTPNQSRMDIGENVMIADFGTMTGYVLNTNDKMFLKMSMHNVGKIPEGLKEEIQVQPTGDVRKIAGYTSRRYRVRFMERTYDEWLSKEVPGYRELRAINDRLAPLTRQHPLFQMGIIGRMDRLDGFPVRQVMRLGDGRIKTVTLQRVSRDPIDPSVFRVPPGYGKPY